MTSRPKLVCVGETFLTKPADHHRPWFEEYFDVSEYDQNKAYDKSHTFVYRFLKDQQLVEKYRNTGCKFIADGLWETEFFCDTDFDQDTLPLINAGQTDNPRVVSVPKFFWFEEYLSQQHKKNQVIAWPYEHHKTKDFLMLIGKHKRQRENLLNALHQNNLLDRSLHSVLFGGKALEGKIESYVPAERKFSQRNYESEWYNTTHYTLVVESSWDEDVFITEKTFKPIMYGHPFIIWGNAGSLKQLKSWGFETFEGTFDQSYDVEYDIDKRLQLVVTELKNFRQAHNSSVDKIKHNFYRFWDTPTVKKFYYEDLLLPILNFVN